METKEQIEALTKQELNNLGMRIQCSGFRYWIAAVTIALDYRINNTIDISICNLYINIAKMFKSTQGRVERSLRYAREKLDVQKYFNVTYKIDNSVFLFLLMDKVEEKLKEGVNQ